MPNKKSIPKPKESNTKRPLVVAAIALFCALLILVLLLSQASDLVALGLVGYVWYVLLILLGLAAAISLFYLFKSYARYSGKVFGGKLELGGPGVLMLTVVGLGFWLVPQPNTMFNITLYVEHQHSGLPLLLNPAPQLSLDLGADHRQESIGRKGEVHFVNIPAHFQGQTVAVKLIGATEHQLLTSDRSAVLTGQSVTLKVQAKTVELQGTVLNPSGQAIANANIQIQKQQVKTNQQGQFSLLLPANLTISQRHINASANGFEPWRGSFVLGSNPLMIQLQPKR